MNLGTAQVIRANARSLPLADDSVDLVVTSPPYFALRSYQDAGVHYSGQIGDEPTPAEFVDSLLEVTRECVRVLKPSGSLWVNLGDKYAQDQERSRNGNGNRKAIDNFVSGSVLREPTVTLGRKDNGAPRKSLIGIPWRYALRCIDDLGLILRAEVIWSKPNGLPESVTDRVRRSHEQWFHFTLQPRYFSAVDEIREPHLAPSRTPGQNAMGGRNVSIPRTSTGDWDGPNPLGKLPGSVWNVEGGESVTRSVLSAVAAGALSIDEGERILWTGATNSGPRSGSTMRATAGTGLDQESQRGTERSTYPAAESSLHTGSSTRSWPDLSETDSPSTTCAATLGASIPTTSSPSLSPRTSDEPIPSGQSARAGTASQTPTSKPRAMGASIDGVPPVTASDSVWVVPTEPLKVPAELGIDHFAAFPTEFPKRIIQGWSPSGVCVECGEGRRPVTHTPLAADYVKPKTASPAAAARGVSNPTSQLMLSGSALMKFRAENPTVMLGYTCACPEPTAPTTPAVVLDPFGGTGTTAMVAKALGRHGISVDMSADYCRLAEWRVNDRNQLAKLLGVEKVAPVDDAQLDLFGGEVA